MRMIATLLWLAAPVAFADSGIYQEFSAGFGGVTWGTDFTALVANFPGGYEEFSTTAGGICYILNIDDSALGLPRSGQHVGYGIGADGNVDIVDIHFAYDQTSMLMSTIKSMLGPPKSVEIRGFVTTYQWPPDHGLAVYVRTTSNLTYGLTSLFIAKHSRTAVQRRSDSRSS
jgi:hypothetical protein